MSPLCRAGAARRGGSCDAADGRRRSLRWRLAPAPAHPAAQGALDDREALVGRLVGERALAHRQDPSLHVEQVVDDRVPGHHGTGADRVAPPQWAAEGLDDAASRRRGCWRPGARRARSRPRREPPSPGLRPPPAPRRPCPPPPPRRARRRGRRRRRPSRPAPWRRRCRPTGPGPRAGAACRPRRHRPGPRPRPAPGRRPACARAPPLDPDRSLGGRPCSAATAARTRSRDPACLMRSCAATPCPSLTSPRRMCSVPM